MPEPLIHFIIPFALLVMIGFGLKKSVLIASLAVLPDLDVLFHVHRSISHSAIFILAVVVPIALIIDQYSEGKLRKEIFIGIVVVLSHPFMDTFQSMTPILWPLLDRDIHVITSLTTNLNSISNMGFVFNIEYGERIIGMDIFKRSPDYDAPVFTGVGLAMSLILMLGAMLRRR